MKWLFLQSGLADHVDSFSKGNGPIGVMLSIALLVVGVLAVLYHNIQTIRLRDKKTEIQELKGEIKACREEARDFSRDVINKLNQIIERNSTIIQENNITINENASVLNQAIGFMKANGEKMVELIEKVLRLKN
jgi:dsDNA-specific endonuclease/ATPase MutS2